MIGRRDFFFLSCMLYFFPYSRFSYYLVHLFILFHSCCFHAWVIGKTPVHEFPISYCHTEWYLLFFERLNSPCFGRSFACWIYPDIIYPEWPHRQCVGLVFRRSRVRGSLSAVSLVICSPARIAVCNTWSSGGTALCRVEGATSQLDLLSLTPLSVAGCGWVQLGLPIGLLQ